MGVDRATGPAERSAYGTATARSTHSTEWYLLDSAHGCAVAGSALEQSQSSCSVRPPWRREGVFAEIIEALQVTLDQRGLIDWDLWCIDGANVRAARAAAGAKKKVSTGIPTNRRTTLWAAAEAGLDRNSTWLLTVAEHP